MEFAKIQNHKIARIISTSTPPTEPGWQQMCLSCGLHVGDDIRMLDAEGKLRPVADLVAESYIKLATAKSGDRWPEGTVLEKVVNNQIVKKTLYDFAVEGVHELKPLEYLDHESESIKSGSIEELLELGKITQQKADELKATEVRAERDKRLAQLDAIVMHPLRWAGLTVEKQVQAHEYRQKLLDVPQQLGFPWAVNWPEKPTT